MRISVIEPDIASGEKFVKEMRQGGFEVKRCVASIAPRVIGDKMNETGDVERDLQNEMDSCAIEGAHAIVVACNTLQLWLPKVTSRGVRVVTTFEAVDWLIKKENIDPVWLGTWPLVREIDKVIKYKTLVSLGRKDLQDQIQEIIWRVKAVEKSDVSGAVGIENIDSKEEMMNKAAKLFEGVKSLGIMAVVLGCTELPILIEKYMGNYDFAGIELIDPAKVLVKMLGEG